MILKLINGNEKKAVKKIMYKIKTFRLLIPTPFVTNNPHEDNEFVDLIADSRTK